MRGGSSTTNRNTQIQEERHTDTDTDADIDTHTHTDTQTQTHRHTDTHIQRQSKQGSTATFEIVLHICSELNLAVFHVRAQVLDGVSLSCGPAFDLTVGATMNETWHHGIADQEEWKESTGTKKANPVNQQTTNGGGVIDGMLTRGAA